ncbi:dipeptidase [Paraclostridium sordellii]|uniref:dipeptidase n=1 Tax=Paraclostridium sordellii TaxID=1505 RepID=UPI0005DCFF65|nr:dipeptidase [Paeniclostridium sordellii]CEQ22236.1 peptidase [[Clostridium] sordellii] [Paeniclostridium sordellii]
MKFIDLHCDTIDRLLVDKTDNKLNKNLHCVDIEKLIKGECLAQTFALYVDIDEHTDPYLHCMDMAKKFHEEIKSNSDLINLATNYKQIIENEKNNKISALLAIEEGAVLEGDINKLIEFYNLGVRMITLTWNHENEIGYPHVRPEFKEKGLKAFGLEVVEKMNELGMIVDVSHLSDLGFYDVARISKKPFIATHSNARFITNHSRNLTDDMIKVLANKGGVTGINFCSAFIGNTSMAMIDDMVKHIKHIKNVGGIESIALGSDFDGIDCPVEIKDVSEMGKLAIKLEQEGFTIDEIEKIYYKNALRVIKDVM